MIRSAALVLAVAALALTAPPAAAEYEFGIEPSSLLAGSYRGDAPEGPFAPMGEGATPDSRAGAHPFLSRARFALTTHPLPPPPDGPGGEMPHHLRDVVVELPPGFVGNPQALPRCEQRLVAPPAQQCPLDTAVGLIFVPFKVLSYPNTTFGQPTLYWTMAVFNMEPPHGQPAMLGFATVQQPLVTTINVNFRLDPARNYAINATVRDNTQIGVPYSSDLAVWGVPQIAEHDPWRGWAGATSDPSSLPFGDGCVPTNTFGLQSPGTIWPDRLCQSSVEPKPFLTNPTRCDGQPVRTTVYVSSWQNPGRWDEDEERPDLSDPDWKTAVAEAPPVEGCEQLDFSPDLDARPTTDVADSPTGLDVDLRVPQNEDCEAGPPVDCGRATAHLKDTTVELPEGIAINPSGANGLEGCTSEQIGLATPIGSTPIRFDGGPVRCPEASRIGRVEVQTPLLDHPVEGSVYVATPHDNPFESLLAIYIVLDDPESGTLVKLAGRVTPDPQSGQLRTTVAENPQLPFEEFRLRFFGGARAPLRTPAICGEYATSSQLTSWAAPDDPVASTDTYEIAKAPGGGPCPSEEGAAPHAPSFEAGAVEPFAGRHSPFVVNLRREDGSQRFSAVTLDPPPGLTAKLAGTPTCPEAAIAAAASRPGRAEQSSPSCPAASRVGSVYAAAGAGPAPYWAPGTAYLAGPYKGAPLSLAIVTPAVAGPFDLGTVVVRTALRIDPATAQITAVSDALPRILDGIPLDVRQVSIRMDKPEFTLNPTSCDPMSVSGQLTSTLGQVAPLASRFQLAECARLRFKPRLALRLKGGTRRGKHPKLIATVRAGSGEANISRASVKLPRSAFLDQAHIGTVCTRVQFAADACPAASVYGRAVAHTPLLDYPLQGKVYLRSSSNLLPDLVADLRGPAHQPIRIELVGRTDAVRGALRNTFDVVPDAPVSRFRLELFGGKRGLVVNSRNLCRGKHRANVKLRAHNGRALTIRPLVRNDCAKKRKKRRAKRSSHGRRQRLAARQSLR